MSAEKDGFTGTTSTMERISVRIPRGQLEEIDAQVENGEYPNRSEAIRQRANLTEQGGGRDV